MLNLSDRQLMPGIYVIRRQRPLKGPWTIRVLTFCCAMILCSHNFDHHGGAWGAESIPPESFFTGQEVIPVADWKEVSADERWRVMTLLIDHMQSNFARLRSWKGTYRVRSVQGQSPAFLKNAFGDRVAGRNLTNVEMEYAFKLTFSIDLKGERIYRQRQTQDRYWRDLNTNEQFTIPDAVVVDERSFVAGEEYVHFDPVTRWPEFSHLVGNADAQHKRAAFREPVEHGKGKHYGDLLEPRAFFGYGDGPLWETLNFCLDSHNGKLGLEGKRKAEQWVHVYEAEENGGQRYRLDVESPGMQSGDPMGRNSWVFDGTVGFHPTGMRILAGADQKMQETQWRWQSVDGIYIPVVVLEHFFAFRGQVKHWRESELVEYGVNVPLDADQFTLAGLGLEEGDLVIDKIDRAVQILRDGQTVRLGGFGDQYVAPPPKTWRDSPARALFVTLNVLILIGFVAWTMRRRKPV